MERQNKMLVYITFLLLVCVHNVCRILVLYIRNIAVENREGNITHVTLCTFLSVI
jgi:hypothetical protein